MTYKSNLSLFIGAFFVLGVDLLLLLEALLVLLLGVLLGLLRLQQPAVERAPVETDDVDVFVSDRLLVGQQLLQDLPPVN
jgi:hypothetical protein